MHLPDKEISYEEIFYRKSDTIVLQARTAELIDRGYENVTVRLSPAVVDASATRRSIPTTWRTWKPSARKSFCRARRWVWAT